MFLGLGVNSEIPEGHPSELLVSACCVLSGLQGLPGFALKPQCSFSLLLSALFPRPFFPFRYIGNKFRHSSNPLSPDDYSSELLH